MINGIDDLNKIVEEKHLADKENKTIIKVSMSTCAITAGADTIFEYFKEEIEREGNDSIKLISTGCMGLCHSEPTIEVTLPGGDPSIFGNLNLTKAEKILKDVKYNKTRETDVFISKKIKKIVLKNCGFIDSENILEAIGIMDILL